MASLASPATLLFAFEGKSQKAKKPENGERPRDATRQHVNQELAGQSSAKEMEKGGGGRGGVVDSLRSLQVFSRLTRQLRRHTRGGNPGSEAHANFEVESGPIHGGRICHLGRFVHSS